MSSGAAKLTFAIRAVNEAKAALAEARQDIQDLSNAAESASGRFGSFGGALSSLGSSMQTVGTAAMVGLVGGIGAATAGLGLAIRASADFERQLNIVASVAGATGNELAELKQVALALGESTAFSAGEVTRAMEVLAANGISTRDIIDGAAKAALDLAAAGSTDLVQAADTVSTAMAVWNLKTSDLTDTINRLAGAANVSRFGVEDMALAIAQGGGAAAAAGVEFADFSAAIAGIAPLFSSGSDAGTSFKTFLQRLVPVSGPAAEALYELGLITADGANKFFDAQGKLRPMAEIVDELHRAVSRLSEQDRTALLTQAFGTDAMRTVIGLSRMTKEEFEALQRSMGEASAAEIGAQRMQGLAGAVEQLKGAMETARIELGDRLNPAVTAIVTALAEFIPVVSEKLMGAMDRIAADVVPRVQEALDGLRAAWDRVREPVMQFLQSKEAAQIGLGILAAVLLSVAVAAGSAAISLAAAVAPVAALGLAIGGVIIIADKLGVDWGRVWDGIREAVTRAVDWLMPRIQSMAEQAGALLRRFGAYWETELQPSIERVIAAITTVIEAIEPVIKPVIDTVIALFKNFVETVTEVVGNVLKIVGRLIDVVVQLIQGDWRGAWESAKEILRLAIDTVLALLEGALRSLRTIVNGMIEVGRAILSGLGDGLKAAWTDIVLPFVSGLKNAFLDLLSGAWGWLYDIGKGIITGLLDGMKAAWDTAADWVGGLGNKIKSLKGPPEKDRVLLYDIGRMIIDGLNRGLKDAFDEDTVKRLRAIGHGLIRSYKDSVEELEDHVVPHWRNLGEALSRALEAGYLDRFRKNKPLLERVVADLAKLQLEELPTDSDKPAGAAASDQAAGSNQTGKGMPAAGSTGPAVPSPAASGPAPPPLTYDHESWAPLVVRGPFVFSRVEDDEEPAMPRRRRGIPSPIRQIILELNGRELARAILPDLLDEAERQGVVLA